jgi:hypothetical protein
VPTRDKQAVVEALRTLAERLGTTAVSQNQFVRESGISIYEVRQLFGTYYDLVRATGLTPLGRPTANVPMYSDEDMLAEIVRVLHLPDSKLTRLFYEQNGSISLAAVHRRFGGWRFALRAAAALVDPATDPVLHTQLQQYVSPADPQARSTSDIDSGDESTAPPEESASVWGRANAKPGTDASSTSTSIYGEFINFRGLQHAPVNEQGVVFLFGMVCRELGYVVEIVRSGFPDCEAKRRIQGRHGQWQRVRIEFEFQSRSFRSHGHDSDQCDLIVCWEHNWPDCPIEVLELKSAIAPLSSTL